MTSKELRVDEDESSSEKAAAIKNAKELGEAGPDVMEARRWRWFSDEVSSIHINENVATFEDLQAYGLIQWNGSWMPAPLEWQSREVFPIEGYRKIKRLEVWLFERMAEALETPFAIDICAEGFTNGEIPASGTRGSLQDRPEEYASDRPIGTIKYGSVDWAQCPVLPPRDPYSNVPGRKEQTSEQMIKIACEAQRIHGTKEWDDARQPEVKPVLTEKDRAPIPRSLKRKNLLAPRTSIYVRDAVHDDLGQIVKMYNWYALHTIKVPETRPVTVAFWSTRLDQARRAKLPFFVAMLSSECGQATEVERGDARRQAQFQSSRTPPDKLIGFVVAMDMCASDLSAFHYTCEMLPLVHPLYYQMGVGKNLLDHMIRTLDRGYTSEEATELRCTDPHRIAGRGRTIKKILLQVYYDIEDRTDYEWQKSYLETFWDFDLAGTLLFVCEKDGKG